MVPRVPASLLAAIAGFGGKMGRQIDCLIVIGAGLSLKDMLD
jgi:hypothetical protein